MIRTAGQPIKFNHMAHRIGSSRGKLFGFLIIGALLAFELFNYTTTDYALNDLLGGLRFSGIRWATILAIAFCGIDFAGIARLFTPEKSSNEPKEVWYLFGAWLLAASMNAMLTWWGVALAIVNHQSQGGSVIDPQTLLDVVPIFVAIMVWVIRVLIIGTFSVAGDRLFSQVEVTSRTKPAPVSNPLPAPVRQSMAHPANFRSVPRTNTQPERAQAARPDPTYHPANMTSTRVGENQTRH